LFQWLKSYFAQLPNSQAGLQVGRSHPPASLSAEPFEAPLRGAQGDVDGRGLRHPPRIAAISAYEDVGRFVSGVAEAKNKQNERIRFAKRNETFRIPGRKSLKSL
jgi:hypothetical protein